MLCRRIEVCAALQLPAECLFSFIFHLYMFYCRKTLKAITFTDLTVYRGGLRGGHLLLGVKARSTPDKIRCAGKFLGVQMLRKINMSEVLVPHKLSLPVDTGLSFHLSTITKPPDIRFSAYSILIIIVLVTLTLTDSEYRFSHSLPCSRDQ